MLSAAKLRSSLAEGCSVDTPAGHRSSCFKERKSEVKIYLKQ